MDRLLNETDALVDQINNVFIGNLTDVSLKSYYRIESHVYFAYSVRVKPICSSLYYVTNVH